MDSLVRGIAVDLGGTFLRCGLVEETGEIGAISRTRIRNFLDGAPSDVVWELIFAHITAYADATKGLLARHLPIVFSFPGPVENRNTVLGAPTVVGRDQAIPDISRVLSNRTGRPVRILNDISAAAWYLSRHTRSTRFMVVTVSSGIGSKIFDRDHRAGVLDEPSYCGEIGHMVVDYAPNAMLCDCGGRGHLGAIASGRGAERLARRIASADRIAFDRSECARLCGLSVDQLTNEDHLVPAALSGDEWALGIIRASIDPLSEILLAVVLAAGLEELIIIGGFAQSLGSTYLSILTEAIARRASAPVPYRLAVKELVQLGRTDEETCLRGAGVFAALLAKYETRDCWR